MPQYEGIDPVPDWDAPCWEVESEKIPVKFMRYIWGRYAIIKIIIYRQNIGALSRFIRQLKKRER